MLGCSGKPGCRAGLHGGSSDARVRKTPQGLRLSTLPQTSNEPEKGPLKEDLSLERTLFQVPCLFGRVYVGASEPRHLMGAGDSHGWEDAT